MDKTTKHIIEEEIENFTNNLTKSQEKVVFLENNTILDSLMKVNEYDSNNQIIDENWNWFKQTLIKATSIPIFQHNCKVINSQLFAVKQFTKINFMIAESAEEEIKFELKKYFINLKVTDINEFVNSFFDLPFEFTSLVVRYVANVLVPEKKQVLVPKLKEAEENFKIILKKREDVIKTINNISKGLETNLPVADIMLLLDTKAFFEDNPLNIGVLEYLARTIKHAGEKLNATFGREKVQLMLQQILVLPSYQKHITEIAKDKNNAFFTNKGTQNTNKQITFDDLVTKQYNPEDYIPKPSKIEPEPEAKPKETEPSEEASEGELNAEQPSEEELMKQ